MQEQQEERRDIGGADCCYQQQWPTQQQHHQQLSMVPSPMQQMEGEIVKSCVPNLSLSTNYIVRFYISLFILKFLIFLVVIVRVYNGCVSFSLIISHYEILHEIMKR